MQLDSSSSGLEYVLLPVGFLLMLASIPRAVIAANRTRAFDQFMKRAPGDVRPGPGDFQVMTIADDPSTTLGTSTSTPTEESAEPSATPVLDPVPSAVLQIVNGPRIRLRAGTKLQIVSFGGAKRRRLDATTTAQGGMRVTHSFDVPANTQFSLQCILPDPATAASNDAAYRQSGVIEVQPIGDSYVAKGVSDQDATSPVGFVGGLVINMIAGGVVGLVIGMVVTVFWRSGCKRGRFDFNPAAWLDIVSWTLLFVGFAMWRGASAQSPAMKSLIKSGHFR